MLHSRTAGAKPESVSRKETPCPTSANAALAEPWKDLWNGDLGVADKIIAEDFAAHAAPLTGTGPDEIRGREALKCWISGIHAILPDLTFAIDVGPITDDEHLIVRWKAHGTYRRRLPPARPPRLAAGRSPSPALTPCASPAASSPSTGPTPTACCSSSSSARARSWPTG